MVGVVFQLNEKLAAVHHWILRILVFPKYVIQGPISLGPQIDFIFIELFITRPSCILLRTLQSCFEYINIVMKSEFVDLLYLVALLFPHDFICLSVGCGGSGWCFRSALSAGGWAILLARAEDSSSTPHFTRLRLHSASLHCVPTGVCGELQL